jgi:peptidoglycan/LPS O-acetylase OafA/YrhL
MRKSSTAINNLRGFAILMIVAFHSSMAYLSALPTVQPVFDAPPYAWTASPIIDANRFIGIDIFCASQFLYLMQLMFFVSGLFVWRSIERKGPASFLSDRLVRLGVPFVLGTFVLMPLAYYPVFRLTAADPSWAAFARAWTALPFWPSGPMWFLWFLLVLDAIAAGLQCVWPERIDGVARFAAAIRRRPGALFAALVAASLLTYLPLARIFTPWDWREFGPFSLQPALAPQYALYFFAGAIVGAGDLNRGVLDCDGSLARHAGRWMIGALAAFIVWLLAMGLVTQDPAHPWPAVQIVADVALVLFAAAAAVGLLGWFLKFAAEPRPLLGAIAANGYGLYLFHYFFVLWVQYLLLGVSMFAPVKAFVVFCISVAASWLVSESICRFDLGRRILRGQRQLKLQASRAAE